MVTPLGTAFSTDENAMAQSDVQLLGNTVESLVIEFNQEKFEKFLFSDSASPKAMRQYRKVSSETRSQISSEVTSKVVRTIAHNTSGATSEEVPKTSRAALAAHVKVSQATHRASASAHDQSDGEDQFHRPSRLQTL